MENFNEKEIVFDRYCRRSSDTEDRQVQSIESQERELSELEERQMLSVHRKLSEDGSAFKVGREKFELLLSDFEKGYANGLLVIHPNRIARNPIDGARIIDLMDRKKLRCVKTPYRIYFNTSIDKMMLGLEFLFSKRDSDDKSTFVKNGLKTKALKGIPSGVATLGFLNDTSEEKGNRNWKVDKPKLNLIKILLDLFLTGNYSAKKIHEYSVRELKLTTVKRKRIGGAFISPSRIYTLLTDTIYAGFFYQGGERYELAKYLPRLITEEQHNKIKIILSKRNIPKVQKHKVLYSGFMSSAEGNFLGQDVKYQLICDCKNKFSYRSKTHCPVCGAEISKLKNPKYLDYIFYYDVRKKKRGAEYKSISEKEAVKEFNKYIDENLTFSKELADWSKKYIVELKNREINEVIFKEQLEETNKQVFKDKAARLREMLRDEQITDEEYKTDLNELKLKYGTKKKEDKKDWFKEMNEIADLTLSAKEIFDSDNFEEKRKAMTTLGSNLIWNDKELSIYSKKSVQKLVENIKGIKSKFPEFEPKNYKTPQGSNEKIGPSDPIFSSLLGR